MTEISEEPWTLADRYKVAHAMAKSGASREEIMRAAHLTAFTATCIVNRHNPGAHNNLTKNTLE